MSADSSLHDFASAMLPAVRKAAKLARSLEGRVVNDPKLEEETAVKQALTAADKAAQETLLEPLLALYPGVALAAEEDTPLVARFPDRSDALVIIDPIDGTLHSYLEARGPYSVILGLAIQERLEAALVALPREGLLFQASAGGGAFSSRDDEAPRPVRATADGRKILVSNGMPEAVSRRLVEQGFEVVPASGGAVAVAPLIPGVRAGLRHASGANGVSIRGRVGTLISREAGVLVRGDRNEPFPTDLHTPCSTLRLATSEEDLQILADALSAGGLGQG
jgi:fructose-1,6-bisphosphatase/inositol monophosphatase family enzyme